MSDIFDKLDEVSDEASFLEFINLLYKDAEINVEQWVNTHVVEFLESAHAWGENTIDGNPHYKKSSNPWKRCADILYMGKIYE